MGFLHSMTAFTEGIKTTQPAIWRSLEGVCGVYWEATAVSGARGYYVSPDPRILLFSNDVSSQIQMSNHSGEYTAAKRPMLRAIYVPPGMPMWTRFIQPHSFEHLDLHFHHDWLLRVLTPIFGRSAAQSAIMVPTEISGTDAIDSLVKLFIEQLAQPTHHPFFSENLASCIATGIMRLPERVPDTPRHNGITDEQMQKLRNLVAAHSGQRLSVADMSRAVGYSESWFFNAFRESVGTTPLKWLQQQRIELAKTSLFEERLSIAETSSRLGFSDQAHFTRVFRQIEGITPAAWLQWRDHA